MNTGGFNTLGVRALADAGHHGVWNGPRAKAQGLKMAFIKKRARRFLAPRRGLGQG